MNLRVHLIFCFITECISQMLQITTINEKEDTTPPEKIKAPTCMHVDERGYITLRGGTRAGRFTKHKLVKDSNTCIDECCQDETCSVAYMPGKACYTVTCTSDYLCEPIAAVPSSLGSEDVQITHIIRNKAGYYNNNLLRRNVVPNNTSKGNKCEFSCMSSYNKTKIGKIGDIRKIHNCADMCCLDQNCEAALIRGNSCITIENLCDKKFLSPNISNTDMIVHVNKRNGKKQFHKGGPACPHGGRCPHGACGDDFPCLCDVGSEKLPCTKRKCHPACGPHGKCESNNKCTCDEGWRGHTCNNSIVCTPHCENGLCVTAHPSKCKCDFGWTGHSCNKSYMELSDDDDDLEAGENEEVFFVDSDMVPELKVNVKHHKVHMARGTDSLFTVAVFVICGIAIVSLATSAAIIIAKRIVGKKVEYKYEYLEQ